MLKVLKSQKYAEYIEKNKEYFKQTIPKTNVNNLKVINIIKIIVENYN